MIDYLNAVVDSNRKEFARCEELLQKQAYLQLLDREKYNELCASVVKQALGNQAQLFAKHKNVLLEQNELVDDVTMLQTRIEKKDDEIHDLR